MSTAAAADELILHEDGPMRQLWRRLRQQRFAMSSLFICLLFLLTAVYAEIYSAVCDAKGITPVYERVAPEDRNLPPSEKYWMGTDYLGRSVMTRAVFGTRTAVKVGLIASLISAVVGVFLGVWAGYRGGKVDDFVVWIYSTFASMPT